MKRMLIILIIFVFTFVSCFSLNILLEKSNSVNSNYIKSRYTIVIDAGHGGKDCGTIAADGTFEKDINLGIALKLYDFLRVAGIDCKAIRNDDVEYYPNGSNLNRSDLYNRLDFVNNIDNSLLVSIHQNHFEDTSEWGMQVWYTANEPSSKILADEILNLTKTYIQPNNKRINKASDNSYYILYKATVPSVMVECGFMSNIEENNKLKTDEYQKKLGFIILNGINSYLVKE